MANTHGNFNINLRQLLIPISLSSLAVFLLIAHQSIQVIRDRGTLNDVKRNQEQAFQESQRLQAQLNALLVGTQQLADKGNKNAKVIADRLRSIGIQINTQQQTPAPASTVSPAPLPISDEDRESSPVKP